MDDAAYLKQKEQMIEKYGSLENLYKPCEYEMKLFQSLKPFMVCEHEDFDSATEEWFLCDFECDDSKNEYNQLYDNLNDYFSDEIIKAAKNAYKFPSSPMEAFDEYSYIKNLSIDRESLEYETDYNFADFQCVKLRLGLLINFVQEYKPKTKKDAAAKLAFMLLIDDDLLLDDRNSKKIQEIIKFLNDGKPIKLHMCNYF